MATVRAAHLRAGAAALLCLASLGCDESKRFQPGEVVRVTSAIGKFGSPSEERVLAAPTRDLLDRVEQLVTARDTTGLARMVTAGQARMLRSPTYGRVIQTTVTRVEVRIEIGDFAGESVWVSKGWVEKR